MFLYLGSSTNSKSSKHRAPTVMFLYLGGFKKFKKIKIPSLKSDVSLLGEFKKFNLPSPNSDVSLLGEFKQFKKFKIPSPNSDVSLPGELKQISPKNDVSLPGEFKKKQKKIKCSFCLRSWFFSRPVTGLLGRPAAFH